MSLTLLVAAGLAVWSLDRRMYPLRHLPRHRHCLKNTGLGLKMYAGDHGGRLPVHTNGYADALLLTSRYIAHQVILLTGPGYDATPFERGRDNGTDIPEDDCGRVYIQGLRETDSPTLIVMFDKLPTPGTDHCFGCRHFKPLGREVLYLDGHVELVLEADWPRVVTQQIEQLVSGGMERATAEWYYSQEPAEIVQGWKALLPRK